LGSEFFFSSAVDFSEGEEGGKVEEQNERVNDEFLKKRFLES
jgi:hypothetical protein